MRTAAATAFAWRPAEEQRAEAERLERPSGTGIELVDGVRSQADENRCRR